MLSCAVFCPCQAWYFFILVDGPLAIPPGLTRPSGIARCLPLSPKLHTRRHQPQHTALGRQDKTSTQDRGSGNRDLSLCLCHLPILIRHPCQAISHTPYGVARTCAFNPFPFSSGPFAPGPFYFLSPIPIAKFLFCLSQSRWSRLPPPCLPEISCTGLNHHPPSFFQPGKVDFHPLGYIALLRIPSQG